MLNRKTNKDRGTALAAAPVRQGGLWHLMLALGVVLLVMVAGTVRAQDEGDFDYKSQTLRVGVWMEGKQDGDILQRGEKFTVGFQINQDAYAVVYRIDANGEVVILWPRTRYDDGFAFGGHEYLLPVSGGRRLVASENTGEGFVEAIVSSYPFDLRDLELDFHHEYTDNPFNFRVAGDPFLAMNEVNYVVTGLEDSGDYVITNYLTYYVHEQVDHPRYLCNQCHFEDDVAYQPYTDNCTLEIQYDYGWNNNWYDNYGYYPVYSQPVYVYVDPWTWRPWVNFWYDPWYVCAPTYGWGWNSGCYTWHSSPYYWGDSYTYYNNGYRRYRPLDRHMTTDLARTKTREFSSVTGLVGRKSVSSRELDAMRTRTSLTDARGSVTRVPTDRSGGGRIGGVERDTRTRLRIEDNVRVRGTSGLRIRDNTNIRSGDSGRSPVRHTAGGSTTRPSLTPVRRTDDRANPGHTPVRTNIPATSRSNGDFRSNADKPATPRVRSGNQTGNRGSSDRTIKPVEPRKKGTRIWNTRQGGTSSQPSSRTPSVNSGSRTRSSGPAPRNNVRSRPSGTNRESKVRAPAKSRSEGNSRSSAPKSAPKAKSRGSSSGGSSKSSPPPKSGGSGRSGGKSRRG